MKKTSAILLTAGFMLASLSAQAATPQLIGTFGNWRALTYTDAKGGKVCYMTAKPDKSEASKKGVDRGDIYLMVTHWQSDGVKNVVSAAVGYGVGAKSNPFIKVDGTEIPMPATGKTLWTKDQDSDDKLAKMISKGSKAVVMATSSRGTKTTDTYVLKGSGDAYKAISKECDF